MTLYGLSIDELTKVVKRIGPDAFKRIALAYARERWRSPVEYTDGTGDGGVDAWILLSVEPLVRVAAQFHAGDEDWKSKLGDDIEKMATYRDSLSADNPKRLDFGRCHFVCTSQVAQAGAERFADELFAKHQIRIEVHGAQAIAGHAREGSELGRLLARRVADADPQASPRWDAREEALLAFSFFGDGPKNFRRAVVKGALLALLERHEGRCEGEALRRDVTELLHLAAPSRQVDYALRDLLREGAVTKAGGDFIADATRLTDLHLALALATREREALRARCVSVLEPHVPAGTHHRNAVAHRAADSILERLGALVRRPIADEVLYSLRPEEQPRTRQEREAIAEWRAASERLSSAMKLGDGATSMLRVLVSTIAEDPFARRLATAELFLSLTEHDAPEFATALAASHKHILLDASIAMPMLCALFDGGPIADWSTSLAAYELHQCALARGALLHVASVHLEEMASHLHNARLFAPLFDEDSSEDLTRSRNYYVAHFASSARWERSSKEFLRFLSRFGPSDLRREAAPNAARTDLERALQSLLTRYGLEVRRAEEVDVETPLVNEPPRDVRLLRHDRAAARSLERWVAAREDWLLCSADGWLRGVLNDKSILALDSIGLTDLLSLVQPSAFARPLLSPTAIAVSLDEPARQRASEVWDEIVRLNGRTLSDGDLLERARQFRDAWLDGRRTIDADVASAWEHFRDQGQLPEFLTR